MNHYWWCGICARTAVYRAGDTCLRCTAHIEALIHPSDRITTYRPRPPWGVRALNWITGRTSA